MVFFAVVLQAPESLRGLADMAAARAALVALGSWVAGSCCGSLGRGLEVLAGGCT